MTQEQKAKAYDEALERARKIHNEILDNEILGFPDQIREIFPELRESEDERIYNEIMEFFKMNEKRCIVDNSYTRWIAWLEKQKEFAEHGYGLYYYHNGGFTFVARPAEEKDEENPYDFAVNQQEKPKEQKPYEPKNWPADKDTLTQEQKPAEKQDYSGLNDLERAILRGFLAAGVRNVPVEIIKETAKDCIAHFTWPTKWSKEDDDTINELCNIIAANSKNGYLGRHYVGDLVQKLKSLRPQSKQESSKEDGAMLDSVIRIITQFDNLAHEPTFAGPKWTHPYTKELDLLKKLRNRLFEEND